MKVNRINILIPINENKHRPYLCNEMLGLMKGFGGEFKRDTIKLSGAPESILKVLEELKIKFERLK